jgi:hypothetical protein
VVDGVKIEADKFRNEKAVEELRVLSAKLEMAVDNNVVDLGAPIIGFETENVVYGDPIPPPPGPDIENASPNQIEIFYSTSHGPCIEGNLLCKPGSVGHAKHVFDNENPEPYHWTMPEEDGNASFSFVPPIPATPKPCPFNMSPCPVDTTDMSFEMNWASKGSGSYSHTSTIKTQVPASSQSTPHSGVVNPQLSQAIHLDFDVQVVLPGGN